MIVQSNHDSLRRLLDICEPNEWLMGWCLKIRLFNLQVIYKKGSMNSQADDLSRFSTLGEISVSKDEEIPCFTIER